MYQAISKMPHTQIYCMHIHMTSKYFRFISVICKLNSSFQQILILWQSICIDMAKRKLLSNNCHVYTHIHIQIYNICLVVYLFLWYLVNFYYYILNFNSSVDLQAKLWLKFLLSWRNPLFSHILYYIPYITISFELKFSKYPHKFSSTLIK